MLCCAVLYSAWYPFRVWSPLPCLRNNTPHVNCEVNPVETLLSASLPPRWQANKGATSLIKLGRVGNWCNRQTHPTSPSLSTEADSRGDFDKHVICHVKWGELKPDIPSTIIPRIGYIHVHKYLRILCNSRLLVCPQNGGYSSTNEKSLAGELHPKSARRTSNCFPTFYQKSNFPIVN